MRRKLDLVGATLTTVVVGLGLVSCGEAHQQAGTETSVVATAGEVFSEACGIGLVVDYDGSPGAATRAGALEDFGKMLRNHLAKAHETTDPTVPRDSLTDPIRLAAGIRGVDTLKESLSTVETGKKPGDNFEVRAETADGQQFAYADIDVQWDGTYRVGTFSAMGFRSDGKQCQ